MTPLKVDGLSVALPGGGDRADAVSNISFSVARGEIVCIVGESGSGKSVCAAAVAGLLPSRLLVRSGAILLEGEDVVRASAGRLRQIRGKTVGMVFQEPMTAFNPLVPIGRQIEEVAVIHRMKGRAACDLLHEVGVRDPARVARALPHQLSGGQRQRAMIAMALSLDPPLLIADEPTTALDVTSQKQVLELIRNLNKANGTSVLFITHDFGVVAEIADRVIVMSRGEIVEQGAVDVVLSGPRHPYTRALMGAVPRAAPHRETIETPVLVRADRIRKVFGNGGFFARRAAAVVAVEGADFFIRQGETLGLVGESGSGKSTLARCVAGLIRPDLGRIVLRESDPRHPKRNPRLEFARRVQMVFQDPFSSLNPRRRVGDIVADGLLAQGMSRKDAFSDVKRLFELVRLDPGSTGRFPHQFSGGQKQRVGIARAIALEPELLIADEPVSALDVSVQADVLKLLAQLRIKLGLTMLFITHDLRVAAQVCDRIAVMRNGIIVETGPTVKVFSDPVHAYTRSLIDSIPGKEWEISSDGAFSRTKPQWTGSSSGPSA